MVVSVAALKAIPLTAETGAALVVTSPAEARYVIVRSAPEAVMVSIVVELAALIAVMLASILVATAAARSPLAMVVVAPKKLIDVAVDVPVTVIF